MEQEIKGTSKSHLDGLDPNRPVRIYADGVYDVFHFGHARQLEQCKKLFKNVHLIVGVASQEETEKYKGITVMNEYERAECVRHCKWVDEVIVPCPWIITPEFMEQNNIDFVAHDVAPYTSNGVDDIYATVKKLGKFKETQRTDGISTSDIILRILKDRDMYLKRNLSRGYTKEQLSFTIFDSILLKTKELMAKIEKLVPCSRRAKKVKSQ